MNPDQLRQQTNILGDELREMRDTTAAVKGEAFANLVMTLFEILSTQELVGRLSQFAPTEVATQYVMSQAAICESLSRYVTASWSEADVEEATKTADKMCERQHQLQERIEAVNRRGT